MLRNLVSEDIQKMLESQEELLFNERDFQMHLAIWLRKSANGYDDVDVEYYVPCRELGEKYVWQSELRLDIVVKKGGEYCPVELKYKTQAVRRQILRFDEKLDKDIIVMKHNGAQDLGMYEFWKDVRRIELIRNRFDSVKGGLAVFVTNDVFYTKATKSTSNNYLFCMSNGVHSREKIWRKPESASAKTHPSFVVEREYNIDWHQQTIDKEKFYYCIVTV